MNKPIMAKATAVWLVDNTTLSFKQIADFCGLHELEVQGIADGDVATGMKGFDPIANNQLVQEEIDKAEHQISDVKAEIEKVNTNENSQNVFFPNPIPVGDPQLN